MNVNGTVVENRVVKSEFEPYREQFMNIDKIRTALMEHQQCKYDMLRREEGNLPPGLNTSSLANLFNADKILKAMDGNDPQEGLKTVATDILRGFGTLTSNQQ